MLHDHIVPITDLSSPELEVYSSLSENQLFHYYEPEAGLFIAESPIVIGRALDAGYQPVSILAEERELKGAAAEILWRGPSLCSSHGAFKTDHRFLFDTRSALCHAPQTTAIY